MKYIVVVSFYERVKILKNNYKVDNTDFGRKIEPNMIRSKYTRIQILSFMFYCCFTIEMS